MSINVHKFTWSTITKRLKKTCISRGKFIKFDIYSYKEIKIVSSTGKAHGNIQRRPIYKI